MKRGLCAALLLVVMVAATVVRADLPPDERQGDTRLSYRVPAPQDLRFAHDAARIALGRRIFFDTQLSEPAGLSCASCHDPKQGFASGRSAARGVAEGATHGRFGTRATPSLMYARYIPPLYLFMDDDALVPEPRGGFFADGRVDDLAQLPLTPLTNPLEMGNRSAAMVAKKLARPDYADDLRRQFGADVFATPRRATAALGAALKAYLESDELSPFSSRYDDFLAGRGTFTEQERRGLALFKNPDKGNCASCHEFNPNATDPTRSLFTNFAYEAVAVPRNVNIPANRDARHYDLGLCETAKARHWTDPGQWCGYFRTPGLRNVGLRSRTMHNGQFDDLKKLVTYYATRGTDPWRWYPRDRMFDDVPLRYQRNLNVNSTPYNRKPGMQPTLDESEIDAIVAFLKTLNDRPPAVTAAMP